MACHQCQQQFNTIYRKGQFLQSDQSQWHSGKHSAESLFLYLLKSILLEKQPQLSGYRNNVKNLIANSSLSLQIFLPNGTHVS